MLFDRWTLACASRYWYHQWGEEQRLPGGTALYHKDLGQRMVTLVWTCPFWKMVEVSLLAFSERQWESGAFS